MIPDPGPISQGKELTNSGMAPYTLLTMLFFNKGGGNGLCWTYWRDSVFQSLPWSPIKELTKIIWTTR